MKLYNLLFRPVSLAALCVTLFIALAIFLFFALRPVSTTAVTVRFKTSGLEYVLDNGQSLFAGDQEVEAVMLRSITSARGVDISPTPPLSKDRPDMTKGIDVTIMRAGKSNSQLKLRQLALAKDWTIELAKSETQPFSFDITIKGYPANTPFPIQTKGEMLLSLSHNASASQRINFDGEMEFGRELPTVEFTVLPEQSLLFATPIIVNALDFSDSPDKNERNFETSNIYSGTISFTDLKRSPIEVLPGQLINMTVDRGVITSLQAEEEGFDVMFQGFVSDLKTGVPTDISTSLMPTRLDVWQSENRLIYIFTAVGSLIIVLSSLVQMAPFLRTKEE